MLFCQPATLTLTPENYINIFEKQLEKEKTQLATNRAIPDSVYELHIEHILLWGLEETFPCTTEK
jgi:hypothetical protein